MTIGLQPVWCHVLSKRQVLAMWKAPFPGVLYYLVLILIAGQFVGDDPFYEDILGLPFLVLFLYAAFIIVGIPVIILGNRKGLASKWWFIVLSVIIPQGIISIAATLGAIVTHNFSANALVSNILKHHVMENLLSWMIPYGLTAYYAHYILSDLDDKQIVSKSVLARQINRLTRRKILALWKAPLPGVLFLQPIIFISFLLLGHDPLNEILLSQALYGPYLYLIFLVVGLPLIIACIEHGLKGIRIFTAGGIIVLPIPLMIFMLLLAGDPSDISFRELLGSVVPFAVAGGLTGYYAHYVLCES